MDGHEHCNYVQANATEPVGFMIGAHGMDDGECEDRDSRSRSRCSTDFRCFFHGFRGVLGRFRGLSKGFEMLGDGRRSMASSSWTARRAG